MKKKQTHSAADRNPDSPSGRDKKSDAKKSDDDNLQRQQLLCWNPVSKDKGYRHKLRGCCRTNDEEKTKIIESQNTK